MQGVEKLVVSKMLVAGSNRRVHAVDKHAGVVRTKTFVTFPLRVKARGNPTLKFSRFYFFLTRCTWMFQAFAGLCPDGRQIVNRARGEAANYKSCVPKCPLPR